MYVHPTALIGPDVEIGEGTMVGPYCIIMGKTRIGKRNVFRSHVVIGSPPEQAGLLGTPGRVVMGDDNHVSEFVTIHSSVDETPTSVANKCLIMRGAHIGHDSVIEDGVTISSNATIGGHTLIMRHANIGLGAVTHQKTMVGACSIVGANSFVSKTRRVGVGGIYAGSPAAWLRRNDIGIERSGLSQEELQADVERYLRIIEPKAL